MKYNYCKKISVKDVKKGINNLANLGDLIGKYNTVYTGMIEGINTNLNLDFDECLKDKYRIEAIITELIIQNIQNGTYIDIFDIKANITLD